MIHSSTAMIRPLVCLFAALSMAACQSTLDDEALSQETSSQLVTYDERCVIHISPPNPEVLSIEATLEDSYRTAKLTFKQPLGSHQFFLELTAGNATVNLPVPNSGSDALYLELHEAVSGDGLTVKAGDDPDHLTLYAHPVLRSSLNRENKVWISTETLSPDYKLARVQFQDYLVLFVIKHTN